MLLDIASVWAHKRNLWTVHPAPDLEPPTYLVSFFALVASSSTPGCGMAASISCSDLDLSRAKSELAASFRSSSVALVCNRGGEGVS